jgi:hypothetical protein
MVQESEAATAGSSQPHTVLANGNLKGNVITPTLEEPNPWEKACVLTLGMSLNSYPTVERLSLTFMYQMVEASADMLASGCCKYSWTK